MVASKLAARRRGLGAVSLEMGRKWSGAGFRRGRSDGTGCFRGPASAKTKEEPRPLVLRAALDYWHPYPRCKNGNSGSLVLPVSFAVAIATVIRAASTNTIASAVIRQGDFVPGTNFTRPWADGTCVQVLAGFLDV